MKLSKILAYIFATIALIFEGFFGIIPLVSFILQVILLAFGIFLLVCMFRRRAIGDWRSIIGGYILRMTAVIGCAVCIMLAFVQYQHIDPGVVSDITLSHTGQEIVFIQMSHIASSEFFIQKNNTIQSLANSGYTILYEGVKKGTSENQAIFDAALGFDLTPTLYSTIADLIGLESQDNSVLFAGVSSGSLISVDLSIDDIVRLMGTGSQVGSTGSLSAVSDIETEIRSSISLMSLQERRWTSWVGRGLLNWSLRSSAELSNMLTSGSQAGLFSTIIDRRNDTIVAYIRSHPRERIAIVYGALHFNGVYASLQASDPSWQITHISNSEPYTLR